MKKKQPAAPIKKKEDIELIKSYLRYKDHKYYVIFCLGIVTGYRAGDLLALRVGDVKKVITTGYFEILEGKKKNSKNIKPENLKPRQIKLIGSLKKILSDYIKNRKDYEVLFPSKKGANKSLQVVTVSRVLADAGREFGLKNISAHSMRKTFAYWVHINSDHNLALVKDMLGHSSEHETRAYLGLDREEFDFRTEELGALLD